MDQILLFFRYNFKYETAEGFSQGVSLTTTIVFSHIPSLPTLTHVITMLMAIIDCMTPID